MRRLIIPLVSIAALLSGQNAWAQQEATPQDTLRSSVVTGTRVEMDRFRIPAPISVIGRQKIESSDESALMPSLMEEVPGLFDDLRNL